MRLPIFNRLLLVSLFEEATIGFVSRMSEVSQPGLPSFLWGVGIPR